METRPSVLAEIKADIVKRIEEAIEKSKAKGELPEYIKPEIKLETPPRPDQGDFATGVAMSLAREIRSDGRSVACLIVKNLSLEDSKIQRVDIAGPGFLNFFLSSDWLQEAMARIWIEGPLYGRTPYGAGKKILLEFVSANPTGPLNVVNARAAAVGDCLAHLLETCGYQVSREFYINDAGNQVDILADSLEARYKQCLGMEVEFQENWYKGDYLIDIAKELASAEGNRLLDMPDQERHEWLKEFVVKRMVEKQKKTLLDYGLRYDTWFSEKALRKTGAQDKVIEYLKEKGLTYELDGALWFRSTDFGDDKDRVIVRSDGEVTYFVPDLAYHKNKFERGFEHLIDILGPDHHGYIKRLAGGLKALDLPADELEVLIVQTVRLVRGKEVVKMSKRGGEFITMEELLEEVGKDAARFFFLMRSPEAHLDFDLNLARLQSNENPVFYVQYAHARVASIFRQAKQEGFVMASGPNEVKFNLLRDPSELALMKLLAVFPEEIWEVAKARQPNRLIKYMMDVATAFHAFYTRCRVLGEEKELSSARLYLCRLTQIVLANALRITGISAPESM